MAPHALETEDHNRDAAFNKTLHGKSAKAQGGFAAILSGKGADSQKAAIDEYFKHWDNKDAKDETPEIREVNYALHPCSPLHLVNCTFLTEYVQARKAEYATLTRHYYNLATDLYEYGWGQSFHFCRFAYGEPFHQAVARHEHYLAHVMGMKENMKVLDVGCGVGGPAREMVKFTGANVVGLNNNDYQIERATHYAEKEGLSHKLSYVKGDFMVSTAVPTSTHRLSFMDSH